MTIKNIIFDLGGVIINVDYARTVAAFNDLGVRNFSKVVAQKKQLFYDFEMGKIAAANFRKELSDALEISEDDEAFDKAWTAMLLEIPIAKLNFIRTLREKYEVYLFSNIDEIQLKGIFSKCQKEHGFDNFDAFFDKEYYSYRFKMRKPDLEAFLAILAENNLKAEETLFIDDSLYNVESARKAGLHAIHLGDNESIYELFNDLKEINWLREEPATPSFSL